MKSKSITRYLSIYINYGIKYRDQNREIKKGLEGVRENRGNSGSKRKAFKKPVISSERKMK